MIPDSELLRRTTQLGLVKTQDLNDLRKTDRHPHSTAVTFADPTVSSADVPKSSEGL